MLSGFILTPCTGHLGSTRSQFQGCLCTRQNLATAAARNSKRTNASRGAWRMGIFQQKEEGNSSVENETELEKIIAPPALPTLTTLSDSDVDIDLSAISNASKLDENAGTGKGDEVMNMGAGLSAKDELNLAKFLTGVKDELGLIEWPSFSRVLRLGVVIMVTLMFTVAALYFIDGFFYRISRVLFEGSA